MAQHDYDIADGSGATVRSDINSVLDAIVTLNAGSSAPSTTFANMLWYDTTNGILKKRNNANTAWIPFDPHEAVNNIGSIGGGTQDIDLTLGTYVSATVDTSTTTFTFSGEPPAGIALGFTLELTNGGSQTVNWPSGSASYVEWEGGIPPTLTSAGVDLLTFVTRNAGAPWYGFVAGLDMQQ